MLKRLSFIFIFGLLVCGANAQVQTKQADYCKSVISPEYNEKIIQTTAVLYFPPEGDAMNEPNHASVFFYDRRCNNKDHFAMSEFSQMKDWEYLENLAAANSKPNQPRFVQLEFEGKLSMHPIPSFGQYAWLRAEISVNKINSAKTVEYSLPDFDAKAPLIETGDFMKNFNAEFMLSFYGRGMDQSVLEHILTTESKITIGNQKYSNKEFFEYAQTDRGGAISVNMKNVTRNKNVWRIQGELIQKLENQPPIVKKYDNKYLLKKGNSVRIIYSKLE